MSDVVLDVRHDCDGYFVVVVDDRDGEPLFYTPGRYATIAEACHVACSELHSYERVVDVLDVKEAA